MVKPVKYKKPRRINAVSVTLVAILVVLGVVAWEYLPLYITRQEAYRVLESYGSGNAPTANAGFLEVIEEATARGVVVVNVTQCTIMQPLHRLAKSSVVAKTES